MQRQHFHLPEEHILALKQIAKELGLSLADVIRLAIRDFLKKHGSKAELSPESTISAGSDILD